MEIFFTCIFARNKNSFSWVCSWLIWNHISTINQQFMRRPPVVHSLWASYEVEPGATWKAEPFRPYVQLQICFEQPSCFSSHMCVFIPISFGSLYGLNFPHALACHAPSQAPSEAPSEALHAHTHTRTTRTPINTPYTQAMHMHTHTYTLIRTHPHTHDITPSHWQHERTTHMHVYAHTHACTPHAHATPLSPRSPLSPENVRWEVFQAPLSQWSKQHGWEILDHWNNWFASATFDEILWRLTFYLNVIQKM
jgi:hypothetical protein